MLDKNKLPIYDDKVEKIIEKLKTSDRDTVAQEMGYSTYKSLDIYMRRKNFRWDPNTKNYLPSIDKVNEIIDEEDIEMPVKVKRIIDKIDEGIDLREIAKEEGFKNLKELAEYMKHKGYIWSEENNKYIHILKAENKNTTKEEKKDKKEKEVKVNKEEIKKLQIDEDYLELLNFLNQHKDRLYEILNEREKGTIPRYTIPGDKKSKSYYISTLLGKLLKEFSDEKNVSISECIEGALVEYLRKYGYSKEIDRLIRR